MEEVKKAIEVYIQAGDNRDVTALDQILHTNFQNIQDGFFEKDGIFVFSKAEYIELIRTKKIGGNPRNIEYLSIKKSGNIVTVQVKLESQILIFNSLIICVLINGFYQVINNIPTIQPKQ